MDRVCTFLYKGKPLVKPGETAYVVWSVYPPKVGQHVVLSLKVTEQGVSYHFATTIDHDFEDVFVDANSAWQAAYGRYYEQVTSAFAQAQERVENARKHLEEVKEAINKEVWKNE